VNGERNGQIGGCGWMKVREETHSGTQLKPPVELLDIFSYMSQ
jgi:hypothetical protein